MDNPPSFSLEITQLDAIVEDIPLGFVPATFDEQDPDWAENRSRHRNDPVTMKKLRDKTTSKSKKSTSKASKKKFDDSGRPRLPKGMKYRIDKVPPHPLHMGSLCNYAFGEEIKKYFGDDVLGAFKNTIFDIFLNLPQCNWIRQISKCLLMLKIQQDNKDELHVWVQAEILKFTMLEFAIITGLKCTDNIDDYMYTSSSKSTLISRYFFDNNGAITRSKLTTRVQIENFDNTEDALNLAILFFVHTFMFYQHKKTPINVAHFQIIEDGRYIHFPWGKVTFKKLMSSWQQDFNTAKQLYSLGGMPHILNVWMFECCSEVESKIIVCQRNVIPRILNWLVECIRPKYESFMSDMFNKQDNQAVMDDDTSGRDHVVYHVSDLYSETHKDAADKGEIGVLKIQHHHHGEIGVSSESPAQNKIDEQQQSQEDGSNKQERPHKEDMQEVNAVDKEAGREDDFENEDYSDLQALEDVNVTAKEDVNEVNLKNQESTDVTDVQVRKLQASKAKAPSKREIKKSRVLRSPYLLKYGSGSKDAVDFDKEEKMKYAFDGYTLTKI
ncbi:hypothetical protein BC332_00504 [Capsicum chinense]|nr:hypothetical protein BC332_00504 [Capsicum chinense]